MGPVRLAGCLLGLRPTGALRALRLPVTVSGAPPVNAGEGSFKFVAIGRWAGMSEAGIRRDLFGAPEPAESDDEDDDE